MAEEARKRTLRAHLRSQAGNGLRPIMTNLNEDSSWLVSFPHPAAERDTFGKAYYHVVMEPWLTEPGEMVALWKWFGCVQRNCVAAATNGAAVDVLVREIEDITGSPGREKAGVDAIIVGHTNDDHMDRETLITFRPSIPVFTGPGVSKKIAEWNHFEHLVDMATFGSGSSSWRTNHSGSPLPGWLNFISFELNNYNFGLAMVWTHKDDGVSDYDEYKHEAIMYFPHGWNARGDQDRKCIEDFLVSDPPLRTLAIMHPLKDTIVWGMRFGDGVQTGLRLWRMAKPAHWVNTADQELQLSGVFMKGVYNPRHTLAWGLFMERMGKGGSEDISELDRPNFVDLVNGYNYILE